MALSCTDTDVTKSRLGSTTNRVSQYRTIESWKLSEALRVRCVLVMLRMVWCYPPTVITMSSPPTMWIDSKAQGNFSHDEFHGYALSLTNHHHENPGVKRAAIKLDPSDTSTPKLPDSYVIQSPVELPHTWMAHVNRVLQQDTLAEGDIITWSGYNSMLSSDESVKPSAEIGVYPLFPDKAASASSMTHAMELTMQGTEFLNPGQTSVLGADQPLFAIIKLIQWQYPDTL